MNTSEYNRQYYLSHKERRRERYENNKTRLNKLSVIYNKKRRDTDINYRMRDNLRKRLKNALRGNYKSGSAVKELRMLH